MGAQSGNKSFEAIILQVLRACGEDTFPPFNIFQAAISDLAINYPKEKNFLLKIADERYYDLCVKAVDGLWEGNTRGMNAAAQYLCDKYMVDNGWSRYITRAMVYAFAEHKYGAKVVSPVKSAGQERRSTQKPARTPKPAYRPESVQKPETVVLPQQDPSGTFDQSGRNAEPKSSKKSIMIIAIAAIALAVVFLLFSRHGGLGTLDSNSTDAGGGTIYTAGDITFTLPGIHEGGYTYFTPIGSDDSTMLEINEDNYTEASLEEYWKQDVELAEKNISYSNVKSGTMEIDGEMCYWTSALYADYPEQILYMPQEEQNYVAVSIMDETEAKTNEVFDNLVKGIHYTANLDNTDGYINVLGISVPNEKRWELFSCEFYPQDSDFSMYCEFSNAAIDYDMKKTFNEELDNVSGDSSCTILDQGEIEIDGTEGSWFDYEENRSGGDKKYCYDLYFKHRDKLVSMEYRFGEPGDHSSEIQKITDSIHFEDE